MKYFNKINGDRIYLSPINLEDAETYIKWMCDEEFAKGTDSKSKIHNIESEKEWINKVLEKGEYTFAIINKETDTLMGNCDIRKVNFINGSAELGIFIGEEENRSKGYGREALNLLLNYGFNTLRLHNIWLRAISFNERAIECYKKAGFKECGRRHENHFYNGKYYDEVMLEMLDRDYHNK